MNTLHAAVVTFNLAELEPEYGDIQRITSRLELERMSLVCVVAQELHSLSLRDMGGAQSQQAHREKWDDCWAEALGESFARLAAASLRRRRGRPCSAAAARAEVDVVYCGLGGLLANKGAAAVRFKIRDTSLLFVGAHLAAHAKQADKRNRDFHRINSSLFRGRQKPASDAAADAAAAAAGCPCRPPTPRRGLSSPAARRRRRRRRRRTSPRPSRRRRRGGPVAARPVSSPMLTPHPAVAARPVSSPATAPAWARATPPSSPTRLIEAHDRVVFAGDLNYRLAAPRGVVDDLLERSGLCPAAFDLPRFQHYDTATRAWVDYDLADAQSWTRAEARRGRGALAFAPGYEARFGANAVNAETGNARRRRRRRGADASALDELRALDELPAQIRDGKAFVGYAESPLAFAPTYKVDVGAPLRHVAEARVPRGRTASLLARRPAPYEATRSPPRPSDHRPVFAKFAIMIE
ncbi:hypothetical protein JL721_2134 [Aureococcus anophagefferens]|nr:hypothetical protein JL721_2134 [Aureococcus anophagefferens]